MAELVLALGRSLVPPSPDQAWGTGCIYIFVGYFALIKAVPALMLPARLLERAAGRRSSCRRCRGQHWPCPASRPCSTAAVRRCPGSAGVVNRGHCSPAHPGGARGWPCPGWEPAGSVLPGPRHHWARALLRQSQKYWKDLPARLTRDRSRHHPACPARRARGAHVNVSQGQGPVQEGGPRGAGGALPALDPRQGMALPGGRLGAGRCQCGAEGDTDMAAPVLPRVSQAARDRGVRQRWRRPKPRQPKVRISLFL